MKLKLIINNKLFNIVKYNTKVLVPVNYSYLLVTIYKKSILIIVSKY